MTAHGSGGAADQARLKALREYHDGLVPHYERGSPFCSCGECDAHFLLAQLGRAQTQLGKSDAYAITLQRVVEALRSRAPLPAVELSPHIIGLAQEVQADLQQVERLRKFLDLLLNQMHAELHGKWEITRCSSGACTSGSELLAATAPAKTEEGA